MKVGKNRYRIDTDKMVNNLTPWPMRSRGFVLFIQSLLYPLQQMGDRFNSWANDKAIEASLTSQTGYFEWFLNMKFSSFFDNPDSRISLINTINVGTPVFNEEEKNKSVLYATNEADGNTPDMKPIYRVYEQSGDLKFSFLVVIPIVTKIPQEEFNDMVAYWINKYKVVGKTYKIKIENK